MQIFCLHLVDLSNLRFNDQIESVDKILEDLDLGTRPRLLVFNKIDQVDPHEVQHLCRRYQAIPLSAFDRNSFQPLLDELQRRFWSEDEGELGPT